jgi:hypothetical protein
MGVRDQQAEQGNADCDSRNQEPDSPLSILNHR